MSAAPSPAFLLHELVANAARRTPAAIALVDGQRRLCYAELQDAVSEVATGLLALGIAAGDRVAIWMEKRIEAVAAIFGASAAGAVFVPVNPLLKPMQVRHILENCSVTVAVTTAARAPLLREALASLAAPPRIVVVDGEAAERWPEAAGLAGHRRIDTDLAGIFYTSGSTGLPKGVMVSHRNVVTGACSVAAYLENRADDCLLAALPLSFDAGFSQLTTAFWAGARVVLLNYLLPRDVLKAMAEEGVTGLTAVPPLWMQLAQLEWPAASAAKLRYFANTGGRMPRETLAALRARAPQARPFLMYGLTEAFRATYLPPEEADRRPDSIGRAIPNAEVLVLREDGSECAADEPGELVQRGALVALGYWNDPEKTAERFRPLPRQPAGAVLPEIAVFSGDTVRRDADGFLYFVGRRDEMIKTSGYRVSPTEIEAACHATGMVSEAVAVGAAHARLGQAIVVFAHPARAGLTEDELLRELRAQLPAWMVPARILLRDEALPRNPNGKIDRRALADSVATLFDGAST